MVQQAFKLPDIGEGTAEAELVAWHVEVGDSVNEDQPLCDVMTDKATVEVTSPYSGTIVKRSGSPGEMVPVGGVILVFETDAVVETASASAVAERIEPPAIAPSTASRVLTSPAVRQRAVDLGINLAEVRGSGPMGRVRQVDLERHLADIASREPAPVAERVTASGPAPASPKTRPMQESTPDEFDEVPLIGLRRRIAERMQDAKRRIPHFSYIEEVDVTSMEALRLRLNAASGDGQPKLTLLPFLIRALVRALPEFPQINARFDDDAAIVRRYRPVHAGIATQTPAGLVVTVLRNAQDLDLWGAATELGRLSSAARSGRAAGSDLSGSTITITSLGAMGGIATTPVINSPEVAILGVNKMIERPIVRDGRIEVARMMNLSASFDHRVVDGWDAAAFIQQVKGLLESPALLFVP